MNYWIDEISENKFEESLPIENIINESFYYPASGTDFNLPFHYLNECNSYVYCDYGIGNIEIFNLIILNIVERMKTRIVFSRDICFSELFPHGWQRALESFPNQAQQMYYRYINERSKVFYRIAEHYKSNFIN